MAPTFERLVRFRSSNGQIYYGEASSEWQSDLKGKEVQVFSGSDPFDSSFELSDKKATISEVINNEWVTVAVRQITDNVPGLVAVGIGPSRAWYRSQLPKTCRRGRRKFPAYSAFVLPV